MQNLRELPINWSSTIRREEVTKGKNICENKQMSGIRLKLKLTNNRIRETESPIKNEWNYFSNFFPVFIFCALFKKNPLFYWISAYCRSSELRGMKSDDYRFIFVEVTHSQAKFFWLWQRAKRPGGKQTRRNRGRKTINFQFRTVEKCKKKLSASLYYLSMQVPYLISGHVMQNLSVTRSEKL